MLNIENATLGNVVPENDKDIANCKCNFSYYPFNDFTTTDLGLAKGNNMFSVIKYYELRNKSVLVLCPKKLNENWITYKANYTNNPIAADRLNYDVFFHSDLTRDKGQTNGMDLERVNWSNYDLLVIDESHNFRNGGNIDEDFDISDDMVEDGEKRNENRYQRLMNRIIRGEARKVKREIAEVRKELNSLQG